MPTPSIDLSDLAPVIQSHAQKGRTALLPALYSVQDTIGYIPPEAVQFISDQFNLPPEEINQVVRSFPLFFSEPVSKTVIHVCNNPVCANAGADAVMKRFSLAVEERRAAGEPVGALTIEFAPCLGLCEHAPAMIVQGTSVARADSLSYEDIVAGQLRHPRSIVRNEIAILTANCGKNRVNNIMLYQAGGGYQALKKAIAAGPQFVLDEVKASGLVGRGGAAYPAWKKWSTVAESGASDKYVICNADEAEPGSFKDRVLLEDEPHLILEGLILAGFATGAAKGFIYIRGEYIFQYRVMIKAIEEARAAGFIGEHILGSAFSFEVEVRRGAGTYVAGEETAQIKALEGKPAIPHAKPPYPSISGLYGAPTVVNNVETLANVPYILRAGSTAYRKIGTDASSGTKLFSVSGDVTLPGLYEVPFGVTLRHLIYDLAGGVRGRNSLKAALIGGASGSFVTPEMLDIPLSLEGLGEHGLSIGSGVITVFDDTRDLKDVLMRLARFFADESCGVCAACVSGTRNQHQSIQNLASGHFRVHDLETLRDTAWTHPDHSICGVGQLAANPIRSAMRHWPDLFAV